MSIFEKLSTGSIGLQMHPRSFLTIRVENLTIKYCYHRLSMVNKPNLTIKYCFTRIKEEIDIVCNCLKMRSKTIEVIRNMLKDQRRLQLERQVTLQSVLLGIGFCQAHLFSIILIIYISN